MPCLRLAVATHDKEMYCLRLAAASHDKAALESMNRPYTICPLCQLPYVSASFSFYLDSLLCVLHVSAFLYPYSIRHHYF